MLQTATEVVPHGDQLRLTERYTIGDERQLMVTATLDDPWAFTEPVEVKRTWEWAPQTEIVPGIECAIPTKVVKPERRQ